MRGLIAEHYAIPESPIWKVWGKVTYAGGEMIPGQQEYRTYDLAEQVRREVFSGEGEIAETLAEQIRTDIDTEILREIRLRDLQEVGIIDMPATPGAFPAAYAPQTLDARECTSLVERAPSGPVSMLDLVRGWSEQLQQNLEFVVSPGRAGSE